MKREFQGSPPDAVYYFACCALGVNRYTYEELKDPDELRRSTTVVGYLPIHLVVLVAIDLVEMMDGLRREKERITYG